MIPGLFISLLRCMPGIAASIRDGWLLGAGSDLSAQNCGKVSFGLMLGFMVVLPAVKV
jgi:hypothetical protein